MTRRRIAPAGASSPGRPPPFGPFADRRQGAVVRERDRPAPLGAEVRSPVDPAGRPAIERPTDAESAFARPLEGAFRIRP
ncbi:hypothetical protein TR75_11875 [Hydrogenibacillus schlegelii]|uniref:Uncharacterized protein n=1 Tax=Hydrogenibacillus schlegelii TaxID=1484 RepID=A0A132MGB9_HYDSH|nr:hypothetical protein TR75_11875 [Hydrogenibacillus schlegelii]OAR05300.1 hypothetical protein SA87_07995 [Hydrogenibacillus schlegelii]